MILKMRTWHLFLAIQALKSRAWLPNSVRDIRASVLSSGLILRVL